MNKVLIAIILGILLMSLASAEVIKIEPEVLEPFSIYSGESITRNITIKTDGNYLVYLSWDAEGNLSNMEGFHVDYESPIQVNNEKEVQIILSAAYNFFPDSFTITLYASTEKAEEVFEEEFVQDETIEIWDLELDIESNGTGNVIVKTFKENPASGFSIPSLNIFFHIEASSSIIEGMNETIIKVSYTDDEVNALGIDENELRLYFYNEASEDWELINSWVDTTNNIVYGKTNHFSLWGIFGEKVKEPTIIYRGGGGTKKVYVENKTVEYVEVETLSEEEIDEYGCIITEGYTWCESKQKCLRTWEEECEEEIDDEEIESFFNTVIFKVLVLGVILAVIGIGILWKEKKEKKLKGKSNGKNNE